MDELIRSYLKPILNSDVDDEIIQYIKEMKLLEDFNEFIDNVIDRTNPDHVTNYEILRSALFGASQAVPAAPSLVQKSVNKGSKKQPQKKVSAEAFRSLQSNKNTNGSAQQRSTVKTPKQLRSMPSASGGHNKEASYSPCTPPNKNESLGSQSEHSSGKSKRTKFVNIESFDSTIGMKKGRHPCNCEARNHQLINNCMSCGRIVCEQEGSGSCFFCENMVCTNDELAILESNSKQSDRLYNRLKEQKTSKEWKKAVETRDRLLKADRSGDYKKAIYDDQSDYYAGDKWKSEGKDVMPRIHKSRKDMKLALDFASRMVVTTESDYRKHKEDLMRGVNKLLDTTEERFPKNLYEVTNDLSDVSFTEDDKLLERSEEQQQSHRQKIIKSKFSKIKVANDAFLAEIDRGMCLSMHQPWASLLVSGIKIHEGRTWYSEHRGRLWIHAGSKEPQSNEILEIEKVYRQIYNDPDLVFPRTYPTGCLLGCVFVEDCLSQQDYRNKYSQGESESPYVLICTNPMILPVFYPMPGQHKIFALGRDVHNKAKEGIMSAKWL